MHTYYSFFFSILSIFTNDMCMHVCVACGIELQNSLYLSNVHEGCIVTLPWLFYFSCAFSSVFYSFLAPRISLFSIYNISLFWLTMPVFVLIHFINWPNYIIFLKLKHLKLFSMFVNFVMLLFYTFPINNP